MEQVEGGDLIVNRGEESRPKETPSDIASRDLSAVEGYEEAAKLAMVYNLCVLHFVYDPHPPHQANLDELIKTRTTNTTPSKASDIQSPTTYSHIYLRVQPFYTSSSLPLSSLSSTAEESVQESRQLQFLLLLKDPSHSLTHRTVTQTVPAEWLVPGMWNRYDWVEDLVAEALRVGVEVVGQEYVVKRMGWGVDDQSVDAQKRVSEDGKDRGNAAEGDNVVIVEKPESKEDGGES